MPSHSIAGQAKLYIAEQTKPTYDYDSHILSHHAPRTFKSVLQRIPEETHRGGPQSACGKLHILPAAECGVPCRGVAWRVDWMSFPWQFWTYAAVGGLFGAVDNGFLVMALRRGDLSVLGPINSYKSVVGIIVGIVLLGELPSLMGLAGVAIIILGSYFVFDTTEEGFSWRLLRNREIQYRIWAMVLTAIEAVLIKKVIIYSDTTVSFIAWCWAGALFSLLQLTVMCVGVRRGLSDVKPREWLTFMALIICIGMMQYTTNYTFKHINVGYGLALFQLSTIVSIALGYKIFHEEGIVKKLIGSLIMIGGSVLIIFG